jgi:hypothetical protein
MNDFLLDLWQDLREKKLWPLAAALVLALLAVPVMLKKDAEAPPPAPAQAPDSSGPSALAQAAVTGEEDASPSSDLGVFDPRNPFKKVVAASTPGGDSSDSGANSTGSKPVEGGDKPAESGGGSPGGSAPTGGGTPGSGGGGDADERSGDDDDSAYTYTVDVTFGRRGNLRKRNLERLEFLPNSRQPMVVFMGVSADRTSAVFMVDASMDQTGEGVCKPSTDTCSFVYLKVDDDQNEHFLSDKETNAEYHLKLLRVNKVETKALAARNRKMRKANMARASRLKTKEPRPFSFLPLLVDEQG